IVWESQRELTHSIAASMMVVATFLTFLQVRKDRLLPWILFGFCGGFSTIFKYNTGLVYAALVLSALTIPSMRARIWDWKLGVALLATLAVLSPSLIWIASHPDRAFGSMYKLGIREATPWLEAVTSGLTLWFGKEFLHIAVVL